MNLINKVLILIVIIVVINHLTNGHTFDFIKNKIIQYNLQLFSTKSNKDERFENNQNIEKFEPERVPVVTNKSLTSHEKQAMSQNAEMTKKMTNSFNDIFVPRDDCNDLFIKPSKSKEKFDNNDYHDTVNSLIPDILDITEYQTKSDDITINSITEL